MQVNVSWLRSSQNKWSLSTRTSPKSRKIARRWRKRWPLVRRLWSTARTCQNQWSEWCNSARRKRLSRSIQSKRSWASCSCTSWNTSSIRTCCVTNCDAFCLILLILSIKLRNQYLSQIQGKLYTPTPGFDLYWLVKSYLSPLPIDAPR